MNKWIKSELQKCKIALIPEFTESTTQLHIHKRGEHVDLFSLQQGHFYLVKFADYIVNEYDGFDLSTKWNNGTKPSTLYNKVAVMQINGKMAFLNCAGYDYEN